MEIPGASSTTTDENPISPISLVQSTTIDAVGGAPSFFEENPCEL